MPVTYKRQDDLEKMLEEFHATICFLGADGVDVQRGITGYNSLDVPLKQIMIRQSDKVILLCDHSKFESSAYVYIAPMEAVDVVIKIRIIIFHFAARCTDREIPALHVPHGYISAAGFCRKLLRRQVPDFNLSA